MSSVDERVASIWREILDLAPGAAALEPGAGPGAGGALGAEDDFFALGGTSMQAMALVQRLREEFGVSVGLGALLDDASLGAVSAAVTAAGGGPAAGPGGAGRS
ncbi:phosphopantetheine-binding protein [Streptomyces sp. NPDC088116]|uniref:phosphopantetheine-binding protein n=1 Tax=Streptomyces sp. NPDC088116 TaxID=3365825 RepID=UPI00382C4C4F